MTKAKLGHFSNKSGKIQHMSRDQLKFPHLAKCTYWGKGTCAGVGCRAQALMNNSVDLGNNEEANSRRDQIEKDAKKFPLWSNTTS